MSSLPSIDPGPLGFQTVLHPTDLQQHGQVAFGHALRIAVGSQARLMVLNVGRDRAVPWSEFPGVRRTLVQWGGLPEDAQREDVARLTGMRVVKQRLDAGSAVRGIAHRALKSKADLLVLVTGRRSWWSRWLQPSVAEAVSRRVTVPTLVLTRPDRGFVLFQTGEVSLTRVLVPVGSAQVAGQALDSLERMLRTLPGTEGVVEVLHVGGVGDAVYPDLPPGWTVQHVPLPAGDVASRVVDRASEVGAGLIVMVTHGHDSLLDRLRGSTTERVLRRVECPVLVVPRPR